MLVSVRISASLALATFVRVTRLVSRPPSPVAGVSVSCARPLGADYLLEAVFVGTADPLINVGRVGDRHRAGSGHLVPAATVRRRWTAVQDNLVSLAGAFSTISIIDSTFDPAVLCAVVSRAALSLRVSAPPAWVAVLVARLCRRAVSTAAGARTR